jgi:c-di-GMP-binding flagellar brake protein YcgR
MGDSIEEGQTMEERRRFVRAEAQAALTYTVLPGTQARQTVTTDVSGGGVACVTEKPLAPGASVQASLQLPGREQPVHFTGEVAWSETQEVTSGSGRERQVQTGLRFAEIAPLDQDAVESFVTRLLRPAC